MKKMIIVTDAWHPQINGVVTVFVKIIKLLEGRGFAVTVIHPGLFWTMPLFFNPEIRITTVPTRKVKAIIARERPDYIHIATEGPLGFTARLVCVKNKIPFTTSYHTNFSHYSKAYVGAFSRAVFMYLRWFHNKAENTLTATPSLVEELKKSGFKKMCLWPLGVDTEVFKRNPNAPDLGFKKPIFVHLGRLAVEKNTEEFLKLNLPGTKLVIGDGPLRKGLETKYGKSAIFTGYKKGEELINFLSVSDCFVFPSRTETFGLVALEAMACGVPVAAHDVMGPRDIITNGVDGILDEDLGRAALACLKLDREKCREKALMFTWEKSVDALIHNLALVRK